MRRKAPISSRTNHISQILETIIMSEKETPIVSRSTPNTGEISVEDLETVTGGVAQCNAPGGITAKVPKPANFSSTMMEGSNI